jgi:NADPH2:quinone reductase
VFDAPPELDDVEAAAFTLPFHLGYLALHKRAHVQAGETVLVRAGASAVGTAAIQLAVAAGARVVAIAGGSDKTKLCAGLGAAETIDHTSEDIFDAVMQHTGNRGADVIYDPIGGEQTEMLWTCAALGGRYIPVGFNDDPQSGLTGRPLRKVSMANLSVIGVILAYLDAPIEFRRFGINPFPPDTGRRVHHALLDLVAAGKIRPAIGRRIAMSGVAAALEDHAARRTSGRTVVDLSRG